MQNYCEETLCHDILGVWFLQGYNIDTVNVCMQYLSVIRAVLHVWNLDTFSVMKIVTIYSFCTHEEQYASIFDCKNSKNSYTITAPLIGQSTC